MPGSACTLGHSKAIPLPFVPKRRFAGSPDLGSLVSVISLAGGGSADHTDRGQVRAALVSLQVSQQRSPAEDGDCMCRAFCEWVRAVSKSTAEGICHLGWWMIRAEAEQMCRQDRPPIAHRGIKMAPPSLSHPLRNPSHPPSIGKHTSQSPRARPRSRATTMLSQHLHDCLGTNCDDADALFPSAQVASSSTFTAPTSLPLPPTAGSSRSRLRLSAYHTAPASGSRALNTAPYCPD